MKRIFLIVLDSCGIGYEPDAAEFGDVGADTLRTCAASSQFDMSGKITIDNNSDNAQPTVDGITVNYVD